PSGLRSDQRIGVDLPEWRDARTVIQNDAGGVVGASLNDGHLRREKSNAFNCPRWSWLPVVNLVEGPRPKLAIELRTFGSDPVTEAVDQLKIRCLQRCEAFCVQAYVGLVPARNEIAHSAFVVAVGGRVPCSGRDDKRHECRSLFSIGWSPSF